MQDLVERARRYAIHAHARIDQRRKYSNQPYDEHLRRVAQLVSEVSDDAEMVAAAWLHDTVEDTPATFRDIETEFGPAVARLVAELTDVSRPSDGNRAARKAIDRAHLATASARGQTVKLADLIDNCRDICRHDPRFAVVFLREMQALLDVLQAGEPILLKRARKAWHRCHERLGRPLGGDALDAPTPSSEPVDRDPAAAADAAQRRALRLFTRVFAARDIAEPLASIDADQPAGQVAEAMRARGWRETGVRVDGQIAGHVALEDLDGGRCLDHLRPFARDQVVGADASLSEVIHVLTRHTACFVDLIGEVSGLILREHMQKPIVRMWLFGMITIIETNLLRRIEQAYPDAAWQTQLAPARLDKARQLQAERQRRGQAPRLLDCLQLSDKIQVLLRDEEGLRWMGFESRSVARRVAADFESLRNNLAHAQEIVSTDWPQIARMTQRIEELLAEADH